MAVPAGSAKHPKRLATFNWLCHGVLAVGLVAPCMTIVTRVGDATEVARAAGLIPEPRTYSVLSGILTLLENGNVMIGIVLLLFSVVFPIGKLVVVRLVLRQTARPAIHPRLLKAVAFSSKYSMTDVFVIALLVVASKTMAGGSSIEVQWGTFAFGLAALLSLGLTTAIDRTTPRARG